MPKNLLFLSDKLPKPNYDKKFKNNNTNINQNNTALDEENKNYRSFNKNKIRHLNSNNILNNININNKESGKENNIYPISERLKSFT